MAVNATITAIAQSYGYNINKKVNFLSIEAENYIKEFIRISNRFRKHSNNAQLKVKHINESLKYKGEEILYGYNTLHPILYENIGIVSNQEILVNTNDKMLSLNEFNHFVFDMKPPEDTTFDFHWLSVNGIQPFLKENLAINPKYVSPAEIKWPVTFGIEKDEKYGKRNLDYLVPDLLQNQFISYIEAIHSSPQLEGTLNEITNDGSIQILIPYFIKFLTDSISTNIRFPKIMLRIIDVTNAIISNEYADINSYINNFISIILTPILTNEVAENDFDLQYILKQNSVKLINKILSKFKELYPFMVNSIAEKYLEVIFDDLSSVNSCYGAFLGFFSLENGNSSEFYINIVPKVLNRSSLNEEFISDETIERKEVKMLLGLMIEIGNKLINMYSAQNSQQINNEIKKQIQKITQKCINN